MNRKHLLRVLALGIAAASFAISVAGLSFAATGPAPTPPAQEAASHSVAVGDFFFRPQTLRVARGSTVTWKWIGSEMHNVTFRSLHRHSKTQVSGSYRLRFNRSGTFRYLCTVHGFTGTIVVR